MRRQHGVILLRDLKTPDLTPAQGAGVIVAVIGVAAAELLDESLVMLVGLGLAVALILADAVIRVGRALMSSRKFSDEDLDL